MNTAITYNSCPICNQKQAPAKLTSGKWVKLEDGLGNVSLKKHIKDKHSAEILNVITSHYNLTESLANRAVKDVIARIYDYGFSLNAITVSEAMVTFLRHKLGSDKMKDDHAMVLGDRRLDNILSEQDYDDYHENLIKNARIVRRALCKVSQCRLHKG